MSQPDNITIRSNLYLWLLTGRSTRFANAALNSSIDYIVNSTPDEVTYARRFLKLDVLDNDFYVLSIYATAMMSQAMLREMPRSIDAVFVPGLLTLPRVVTSAPLLGRSDRAFGYIDGAPGGAGGFNTVTITYATASTVSIKTDSGVAATSGFSLTAADGGDFRLRVEDAELYGIFADFVVSSWAADSYVSVALAPTRYPYAATVAKLRSDRTMMRLLNGEGTLAAFESSAVNPALQVGMAGLAVIRRMLKWIADEQSGYTVQTQESLDDREPLATTQTISASMVDLDETVVTADQPDGFHV